MELSKVIWYLERRALYNEIAIRLSGGYFCTHEIPLSTGIDLVGNAIKLAMGEKVNSENLNQSFQKYFAKIYFPETGRIRKFLG